MRIAIVHDDLTQWGGAERVLLAIADVFPEAPIYTLAYDKSHPILGEKFQDKQSLPTNRGKKIITSFLQKLPGINSYFKATLPLQMLAFEQFDFSDFDLVISHTSRFAKAIITKPETTHICYCLTPPRFLWHFAPEKHPLLAPYFSFLRFCDQVSARRPDFWLANSQNTAQKLKRIYHVDSEVLYPFVDLADAQNRETFAGDYFLIVSRLNRYKRVDLAVDVFNKIKLPLKIVGVGPEFRFLQKRAKSNVQLLGAVSEDLLQNLLAGCKGLIVTAEEDFGMTPLEAQALGKGVIAFGKGGVLENVIDGKTGIFFQSQTRESLEEAVKSFSKMKFNPQDCREQAARFAQEIFKERLLQLVKQAKQM